MVRAWSRVASLLFSVLAVAPLAAPLAAQGAVHVVDAAGGPGADFTQLDLAVAAAADGDVLLLRSGDYTAAPFQLDAKGLVVVEDAGATARVGRAAIDDLPAGRFALLQGLTIAGSGVSLATQDDAGALWFERCILQPELGFDAVGASHVACDSVVWIKSLVQNRHDALLGPGPALTASRSRLHLHETRVRQLFQGRSVLQPPAALRVVGSFVAAFGAEVLGGAGLDGTAGTHCSGQAGGDAFVLQYSALANTAVVLGSVLRGGDGGDGFGGCPDGADGADLWIGLGSSAALLAGTARSLQASSPVREDELLVVTLTGKPGDRAWIRYAGAPGAGFATPYLDGELLLGAPSVGVFAGTLPPSGVLVVQGPAPDLPAGVESLTLFLQGVLRDVQTGRFVVSTPSAAVVLDAAL